MKLGGKGVLLAGALLLLAGRVPAAEPLQSKLQLVRQLLEQSSVAQRIAQSNNAPANKQLADAKAHYAKAQAEANAGRAAAATALLDEALRQVALASKLVPDVAQQAAQERHRNGELRQAIGTFQALQKSLTSRKALKNGQTSTMVADTGRVDAMVAQADALIASGHQQQANVILTDAYARVVSTLNNMLAAQTIVYDLKFDSPAEEFRHELARNHSYDELIPIALAQLHTAPETATLAKRYVQQSRQLREAAQRQASAGDFPAALKVLQDATGHLQRSLRVVGVVVPQSIEVTH